MKGIVLAGGAASRLRPITNVSSKQLVPVYDKPLIYYPMSILMLSGIREILIISTPDHLPALRALFGDGGNLGLSIDYRVQETPGGTAEAFVIGADFLDGDDVCMILGDNIFYGGELVERLRRARRHLDETRNAVLFTYYVDNPHEYGVVEYDRRGNVLSIEEKPAQPKSHNVITGLGYYPADVVDAARRIDRSTRGELENTDILIRYMHEGRLTVIPMGRGDAWLDAGTPEMLLEASSFVRTVERRQGLKIACLEEIAFNAGLIDRRKMQAHIDRYLPNDYGNYLVRILEGRGLVEFRD